MSIKRIRKSKNNSLQLKFSTILILLLTLIIIPLGYIFISSLINKPSGNENITTKLTTDEDFLKWFTDFNNLYNQKVKSPTYSLTTKSFQKINNFLNNSNPDNSIYLKNNIYYVNDDITLELDVNTRSLRYHKYLNNKIYEILEIRLLNGKYYVQFINKDYLYKISFNHQTTSKKKHKNQNNEILIKDSIYSNKEFNW